MLRQKTGGSTAAPASVLDRQSYVRRFMRPMAHNRFKAFDLKTAIADQAKTRWNNCNPFAAKIRVLNTTPLTGSTRGKPHNECCALTPAEAVLLLLHVRGICRRSFFDGSVFDRYRSRILRKYEIDLLSPPSPFAFELLLWRGGDLQLWPDELDSSLYGYMEDMEVSHG